LHGNPISSAFGEGTTCNSVAHLLSAATAAEILLLLPEIVGLRPRFPSDQPFNHPSAE
jgi:hypothetical protein